MKVLVIYRSDNGYRCGCCREEWPDYETYDIEDKDPKEWAKQHNEQVEEQYETSNCGRYKVDSVYVISETIMEDGELVRMPE